MTDKPVTTKPWWMVIGSYLDIAFLGFTAFVACREWFEFGFDASIKYFILNGVWCCSSTLARISYKLGATK